MAKTTAAVSTKGQAALPKAIRDGPSRDRGTRLTVERTEARMDFAAAMHLAAASDCDGFLTFDKRLTRAAARLGGIPVGVP